MLTARQLDALAANVDRLLLASLARLGDDILSTPATATPILSADDSEALALERLGMMDLADLADLDMPDLGSLADDQPPAAIPEADAATISASLAALPADLSPLTEPLSDAALTAWLALEQAGSAPLDRLITAVRRLALSHAH